MGLREQAEEDTRNILQDQLGFAWDIALTSPAGVSEDFEGFSNDIAQSIDPDTGLMVSGRIASIAISIASILEKYSSLPENVVDATLKPWIVVFADINGTSYTFKVVESYPDRSVGNLVCILEQYSD